MSRISNASNNAPTTGASEAAKTPRVTPELRRQAVRAFCSGYYGHSRSKAIAATLEGHEITVTKSIRDSVGRDIQNEIARINSMPELDQAALLDELRQEVLARVGELDAPMTEHVSCDCCQLDCTLNYYSTAVSQSSGDNSTTEQFDICSLCFEAVDYKAVASSSSVARKQLQCITLMASPCAGS